VDTATVTGLSLVRGPLYYFVVRASNPAGVSPDVSSDGVVLFVPEVVGEDGGQPTPAASDAGVDAPVAATDAAAPPTTVPTVAAGGGCGCTVTPARDELAGYGAVLAVAAIVLRRRRRSALARRTQGEAPPDRNSARRP
jgi:MYXO-CTERM domain-containing protein